MAATTGDTATVAPTSDSTSSASTTCAQCAPAGNAILITTAHGKYVSPSTLRTAMPCSSALRRGRATSMMPAAPETPTLMRPTWSNGLKTIPSCEPRSIRPSTIMLPRTTAAAIAPITLMRSGRTTRTPAGVGLALTPLIGNPSPSARRGGCAESARSAAPPPWLRRPCPPPLRGRRCGRRPVRRCRR